LGRHGEGYLRHDVDLSSHGAHPVRGDLVAGRRVQSPGRRAARNFDAGLRGRAMGQTLRQASDKPPVLEAVNASISYFTRAGEINVVPDISFRLEQGEALGLVGESGCGKSTVAFAVMRYLGGVGKLTGGHILFEGRDMSAMSEAEIRKIR